MNVGRGASCEVELGKRFRVTGSGKIRRQKAGLRHNLEKKPSKMTRRMAGTTEVSANDVKRVRKLLGR